MIRELKENLLKVINSPYPGPVEISTTGRLILDEHKIVRNMKESILVLALEGVNARYLRECAICQRIFFAKRTNQLCCHTPGENCPHKMRNRRWYEKYTQGDYKIYPLSDKEKLDRKRKAKASKVRRKK